jgi:alpha-glucuronidase
MNVEHGSSGGTACGGDVAEDGYELWLRYRPLPADQRQEIGREIRRVLAIGDEPSVAVARTELVRALSSLVPDSPPGTTGRPVPGALVIGTGAALARHGLPVPAPVPGGGYAIDRVAIEGGEVIVAAGADGPAVVHAVFALVRSLQVGGGLGGLPLRAGPAVDHRVLAHWDNLDGSIERGYAGTSLWDWSSLPETVTERYTDYARACASLGINGTCLTNVNADPRILSGPYLAKVAALAEVLRPYGIRVWLAPHWSTPILLGDLDTADPSDPAVRSWWCRKVDEIYRLVPDFAGFQVKADSEGQPGPHHYGADHARGANMLAEALAPHRGLVLWRAFVYDTSIDPDRAKCAYRELVPLDGRFAPNVLIQSKNGPVDFQPREPFAPLFGAMDHTPVALEVQITQEYLGHSTHLVYLGGMWSEVLRSQTHARVGGATVADVVAGRGRLTGLSAMVGVANTGSDRNWCGHHFGQANWYAFGRLAYDPGLDADQLAREWVQLTWSTEPDVVETITDLMVRSWPAAIDYLTPLGLHHLSEEGHHYGPEPDLDRAERVDWNNTYFHRADASGVGFDRSSSGSGAVEQYHEPLRSRLDDLASCPEEHLLWFHHVAWEHVTRSGRTLIDELEHRYRSGVDRVEDMVRSWSMLEGRVDPGRHGHVLDRLRAQLIDAGRWRDTCIDYFRRFVT